MNDVLALLANANPVRAEELTSLDMPGLPRSVSSRGRLVLVAAVVVALAATTVLAFGGSTSSRPTGVGPTGAAGAKGPDICVPGAGPTGAVGPTGSPGAVGSTGVQRPCFSATIHHPLAGAKKVTLAAAEAALGAPIVLPDTSLVSPSDVGVVWLKVESVSPWGRVDVAVTFPKQGFWVDYGRNTPTIYYDNTLDFEEAGIAHWFPSPRLNHVVVMNGMPAVVGGDGFTRFNAAGTDIQVRGKLVQSSLTAVAQSIADRSETPPAGQLGDVGGVQLYPYVPPAKQVPLSSLSETLGAPAVLPDTARVKPSGAGQAWAEGTCPHPDATTYLHPCALWISFPGTTLSVGYVRPPTHDLGLPSTYLLPPSVKVVGLDNPSGSVSAALVPENGPLPGWVEFDLAGTRIVVGGDYDAATLQAVAQSIVDRLQVK